MNRRTALMMFGGAVGGAMIEAASRGLPEWARYEVSGSSDVYWVCDEGRAYPTVVVFGRSGAIKNVFRSRA